jgi:hypothetical protein
VWIAACGGSGGGGGKPDAKPAGDVCTPGSPFDITGREGVLATLNVHVNASGLVETDTTAELLLLLDATQTGMTAGVNATLCEIKIPDIPLSGQPMPVHFEAPPALIMSVPSVPAMGTLSGTTTCSTFTSDKITIVLGAVLDPPETAPLPEANSAGNFTQCGGALMQCSLAIGSNCVCDQENDMLPGATLLAMNTPAVNLDKVYVDLRTSFTLTGQVFSSDLIEGTVDATLQQGILGCHKADNTTCSSAEVGAIKNINPTITQNPTMPSTFKAVRVDQSLACQQLIDMKDTLFPR